MASAEHNELMTRTNPGTPAGTLLRQYWQPVALTEELDGPRPLKTVGIMGQHLVLFRDEKGRLGLLDRDCPHRGADLAYGRIEDGGLRCLLHGCFQFPGLLQLRVQARPVFFPVLSRLVHPVL